MKPLLTALMLAQLTIAHGLAGIIFDAEPLEAFLDVPGKEYLADGKISQEECLSTTAIFPKHGSVLVLGVCKR